MEGLNSILRLKIDKKVTVGLELEKVMIEDGEDKVVFCLMRKIGDGKNVSGGNKEKVA